MEERPIEMQSQTPGWQPSQADVDARLRKYIYYQSFSAFIASDNDFLIFRRFGALNAKVLLGLQDQLSRLEEDLEALEKTAWENNTPDIHNGSLGQDTDVAREALVCQAQRSLRDYS